MFHDDRIVVARTQVNHTEAAEHLVASDRDLAETALADARRVRDQLDRRNHSYNETAVDDYLANASEDLQEGHAHVEADELVAAVEAYQRAWTAAQRALDVMQRAVDPQVTITRREDPPHDGTLTYSIEGTVWSVRSHEMNASLTINGADLNLTLQASTVPGENATFARRIELDQQVNRLNVSVTNPVSYVDHDRVGDRPLDDDSPPGDGGPPDNGSDDDSGSEVQIGFDVLKLDGDGLPDHYEEDIVGTDPLGPDSDSRFTDADESDKGLLDGAKDFSGDRLTTYQEYRIGSDPLVNDTTGDGLGDGFQVLRAGTDPTVNDTDGDGVPDTEEDLTGDGLTLAEEQRHGIHPLVNDTDGDGLADYAEIHEYDTDPLDPDGDGDNLTDGQEIRLGLDPANPDTDGNGVPDGEETFTTTTADEASGVEVAATGEGAVADEISVLHVTAPNETRANASGIEGATTEGQFAVGPTVRIQNDTDFDELAVTIPIDEDVDLASTDVKVYRWDPATAEGWVPLETEIDRANRSATATVTSTGYFAAFDAAAWGNATTATAQPGWPALEQFADLDGWRGDGRLADGTLVVDASGANFVVTELDAPETGTNGTAITVNATIKNTGTQPATQTVEYVFGGVVGAVETIRLEPGEQQEVLFTYVINLETPGIVPQSTTYEHGVRTIDDIRNTTITVYEDEEEEEDDGGNGEPEFEVTSFQAPSGAEAGEVIEVSARVTNVGGATTTRNVTYYFDGDVGPTREKTVGPGETVSVTFMVRVPQLIEEGTHTHKIRANQSGDSDGDDIYVTVDEEPVVRLPILGQDSAGPHLCLPGGDSGQCSITVRPDRSLRTGHYGAVPDGFATGSQQSQARDDPVATGNNESATARRPIALPKADSIPVQIRVRAETDGEGDRAEVVLETDSETVTVFSREDGSSTTRWVTVRANARALAGEAAELVVHTEGDARIEVDYVSVMADSTDTGIPDSVEAMDLGMPTGLQGVRGTPLNLDPRRGDTNGDGLSDGAQVDVAWEIIRANGTWEIQAEVVEAVAHPAKEDTDRDGILDKTELDGWDVDVVKKLGKEGPYRWDSGKQLGDDEYRRTVRFDSDPMQRDTDGDGADDSAEKKQLHTDPRQEQTYGLTATHEAMLQALYEEWQASSDGDHIARSVVVMNIVGAPTGDASAGESLLAGHGEEIDDGSPVGAPIADMERLKDAELTDATDDFDFVVRDASAGPLARFLFMTSGLGEIRTDVWLSNWKEARKDEVDPWEADSDADGLTDGQEAIWVTKLPLVSDSEHVIVEEAYDLDPTEPDSDGDDALDGGTYYEVNGHTLGRAATDADQYVDRGEVLQLPTDPAYADVAEVFVVVDSEFILQVETSFTDHRAAVRDMFSLVNREFQQQFGNRPHAPYLVIKEWGRWDSPEEIAGDSPKEHRNEMERNLNWANDENEMIDDRGADIMIGFSGHEMGADPSGDSFFSKYADGISDPAVNTVMLGINDKTITAPGFDSLSLEYNLLLHEIGHIYEADHPKDGTSGIMCKYSCVDLDPILDSDGSPRLGVITGEKWMFTTYKFSSENRDIIENYTEKVSLADNRRRNGENG